MILEVTTCLCRNLGIPSTKWQVKDVLKYHRIIFIFFLTVFLTWLCVAIFAFDLVGRQLRTTGIVRFCVDTKKCSLLICLLMSAEMVDSAQLNLCSVSNVWVGCIAAVLQCSTQSMSHDSPRHAFSRDLMGHGREN